MPNSEYPAVLRTGHVSEYDPDTHRARVFFPDLGLVSFWLPVLTTNTLKNHDEVHVDIGEHAVCLMAGNGCEAGYILGAFYDAKNPPQVKNADIRSVIFEDGTTITYDRKNSRLSISCEGDISINAKGNISITASKNMTLKAARIDEN